MLISKGFLLPPYKPVLWDLIPSYFPLLLVQSKSQILRVWVLRRLSFEAQEEEIHHQATSILLLLEGVRLLDWLGSWRSSSLWGRQEVCKGSEIAYFVKIYHSEASPSWAYTMVIRLVALSWTLCGCVSSLDHPFVGSRNRDPCDLRSFVDWSLH